jgi:ribosomal-protein-alanine N-acetyltransferase
MIREIRNAHLHELPADSFFTRPLMDGKQFQLRRMTEDDLDAVDRIERSVFQSPWSRRAFLHELKESRISVALVASVDEKICGYIVVWFVTDELHIGTVAVDAAWRRRGIATTLLKEVFRISKERQCKRAYLEVRRSNVSAQKLYDSFGFRAVGVRPGYYSPQQEDAIIMAKPLHGAPADGGEENNGLV